MICRLGDALAMCSDIILLLASCRNTYLPQSAESLVLATISATYLRVGSYEALRNAESQVLANLRLCWRTKAYETPQSIAMYRTMAIVQHSMKRYG